METLIDVKWLEQITIRILAGKACKFMNFTKGSHETFMYVPTKRLWHNTVLYLIKNISAFSKQLQYIPYNSACLLKHCSLSQLLLITEYSRLTLGHSTSVIKKKKSDKPRKEKFPKMVHVTLYQESLALKQNFWAKSNHWMQRGNSLQIRWWFLDYEIFST